MTQFPGDENYGRQEHDEYDHADEARMEADEQEAAEREALLQERRARQMGTDRSGGGKRVLMVALLLGCAAVAFLVLAGPMNALQMLGLFKSDDGQQTSRVDLEVAKQTDDRFTMDFLMPDLPPEEPPAEDPNELWNKRFEDLKKELEAVAKANNQPEVSLSDMKELLQKYNDQMGKRLADERRKMTAENKRLREEAKRLEEEMRKREEELLKEQQRRQKNQEIDDMQRQSQGVLMDESGTGVTAAGSGFQTLPGDLDANERFLAAAASSVFETSASNKLADPSRTVVQGTIISAVLETAINTELPGNIRAQVTEPVFSFDGRRILMPAGTVLIGTFNNDVEIAQKRVLIAWNRAVTPEGKSIALGSTGTDLLGRAGTQGNVNNRWGTKIGAAVLISSISALPAAVSAFGGNRSSTNTTVNIGGESGVTASTGRGPDVAQQVAGNIAGQVSQQGQGVMEKYLSLPPVIRIPQGEEIRVFVNRDLIFR